MAIFHRHLFVVLAALTAGGGLTVRATPAATGESRIAVIASAHTPVPAIDSDLLRSIYLKKIFVDSGGRPYIPVNLSPIDNLRRTFLLYIIHMDKPQFQNYWNRQYFQGISPPYVLGSQTAVAEFVAKTPGAIGYVQPCYVTPQVHVVLLLSLPDSGFVGKLDKCPDHSAHSP